MTKAFDINSLTLGEVATVERIGGQAITSFGDDGVPMGDMLVGLGLVITKRTNPMFTVAEAQNLTLKEALVLVKGDGNDDDDEDAELPKDSPNLNAPEITI